LVAPRLRARAAAPAAATPTAPLLETIGKVLRRLAAALLSLLAAGLAFVYFVRPGLDKYRAHLLPGAEAPAGAVQATWLGVTGLLLADGEHAIAIDPFFTRPGGLWRFARNGEIAPDEALIAATLQRLGVRRLDAVLVSHSHFDHAMDAGVVARLTGARLVGSPSSANVGRGAGLAETQIQVVGDGAALRFGNFAVRFVHSRHAGATGGRPTGDITTPLVPPARYLDYKQGGTFSILVEHPRGSVLHHGSAGYVRGALDGVQADVVFLGIALIDDFDAYLREVVDAVGAKRVVPTHWDDFTRGLDRPMQPLPLLVDLPEFFETLRRRRDLQVQTLELFRPATLFPASLKAD
jgi:L-ascorbate metabolism protein UlaG (beta-lactamase superfamily)